MKPEDLPPFPDMDPFDFEAFKRHMVEYHARLALIPGWLRYTRHRVRELRDDESGLFAGIDVQIAEKIKELKGESGETNIRNEGGS